MSHHITFNISNLQIIHNCASPHEVLVGNGHRLVVSSTGSSSFKFKCMPRSYLFLNKLLYVPNFTRNLIYVSNLQEMTKRTLSFMLKNSLLNHMYLSCSCLKVFLMKVDRTASTISLLKPHPNFFLIVFKLCILLLITLMLALDKIVQPHLLTIMFYGMLDWDMLILELSIMYLTCVIFPWVIRNMEIYVMLVVYGSLTGFMHL